MNLGDGKTFWKVQRKEQFISAQKHLFIVQVQIIPIYCANVVLFVPAEKNISLECALSRMQSPNVMGVLCADAAALPLCYRGTLPSSSAPVISQLLSIASNLDSDSSRTNALIITIQSKKSKLIITKEGSISVAVHKSMQ
ncbi:unnamed protein product [Anisakis simplex]|uniref:Late endosomal/lysosomal adaptor and MAPK and MTOR activator 5 n=1 Tax=Anisakis simplex TaxID=6269 RepID=A0A0M3JZ20_ANISI|nr:unnamed protein product [Anisakis simplex]